MAEINGKFAKPKENHMKFKGLHFGPECAKSVKILDSGKRIGNPTVANGIPAMKPCAKRRSRARYVIGIEAEGPPRRPSPKWVGRVSVHNSRRLGRFADVLQCSAYRNAVGDEGDDAHVGAAMRASERRRLAKACPERSP